MEKSIEQKKVIALNIAAIADILFTIWLLLVLFNRWPDWIFLWGGILHAVVTVIVMVQYIAVLRLDWLEALKPVCVTLLLFYLVSPIPLILPPFWPSDLHPEIWVRGTRGLASLIVIALSLVYLVKTRKQKNRRKAGMIVCLVFGILFCLVVQVQIV
ncbi:MAG: hypothetical protein VB081_13740 [Christensenella sp.]|uniref:hypothetical protein n=1 Tax=Christensenella sp. TaxID=1935934 RepID=UPI002B21367D|nr:hypothetical protein [Christensenella sp.]MEA5004543.1 hypothetical protein [Christensenella sp.]